MRDSDLFCSKLLAFAALRFAAAAVMLVFGAQAASPAEVHVVTDEVTHVPMRYLTTGPASNAKIYQTHPQWLADGTAFRSTGYHYHRAGTPAQSEKFLLTSPSTPQ